MRGTIRPSKAIDGLLLVAQEHASSALIELREIIKTASRPNGVLHDAPEAFHGVEMMACTSRQQLQAEALLVMSESRLEGLGAVDATAVDDHHDRQGWCVLPKRAHELMDELAKLIGVKMRHHFPKDPVGPVLDGAEHRQQDARADAGPATMLLPGLPFEGLVLFDLTMAQGTCGQALAGGSAPPAGPRQGKAPQDRFIFVEQDNLTTLSLLLEGSESEPRLRKFMWIRIEPSRGTVVTQAPFFNTPRMVSGCRVTPVWWATAVRSSRQFHCDARAPRATGSCSTRWRIQVD
jgi:hypothetical protein